MNQYTVEAGHGHAFHFAMGERIRIGLPEGPQVADMFAFALPDLKEYLAEDLIARKKVPCGVSRRLRDAAVLANHLRTLFRDHKRRRVGVA
jgi:uncharacterized protein YcgI (DUF1989 family)